MNPAHRDRIAFVRIVSGEFERGMDVILHRTGKTMRLNNSTEFMADTRETVSTAVAGDIVGCCMIPVIFKLAIPFIKARNRFNLKNYRSSPLNYLFALRRRM